MPCFFYNIKTMTSCINLSQFRLTYQNYDFVMDLAEFNNFVFLNYFFIRLYDYKNRRLQESRLMKGQS